MKIKITMLVVLLASMQCYGSSCEPPKKIQKGESTLNILPSNLAKLSQGKSPMPPDLSISFNEWKKVKKNEELLKQLLSFKFIQESQSSSKKEIEKAVIEKAVNAFRAKKAEDDKVIEQSGLKNESVYNYVFALPKSDYKVKVAGPLNRFRNIKSEKGLSYHQQIPIQILYEILSGKTHTYQTASRMATFLVLKDLIESKALKHVRVPDTYIVGFDGSDAIDDNNAIVLSKNIPSTAEKIDGSNIDKISDEMIRELVRAIAVGGLWSSWDDGNLYVDGDKLYIVDLEQPNNSKPQDFFHQKPYKYHSDISVGIDHLLNLLKHNKAKLNVAIEAIQQDPLLGTSDYKRKGTTDELIAKLSPIIEKAPSKQPQK